MLEKRRRHNTLLALSFYCSWLTLKSTWVYEPLCAGLAWSGEGVPCGWIYVNGVTWFPVLCLKELDHALPAFKLSSTFHLKTLPQERNHDLNLIDIPSNFVYLEKRTSRKLFTTNRCCSFSYDPHQASSTLTTCYRNEIRNIASWIAFRFYEFVSRFNDPFFSPTCVSQAFSAAWFLPSTQTWRASLLTGVNCGIINHITRRYKRARLMVPETLSSPTFLKWLVLILKTRLSL